jgi:mRNA-degrading endonuclease toxin of MazEF toxin-antitoxin module
MNRGEVVLVDWQFSDRTGSKLRPAVVVQADFLNGLIDDTVLVQITSTRHGIPGTEVEIDPAQEPASGLQHISTPLARTCSPRTRHSSTRRIGVLSDAIMRQIGDCLKKVLELP